MRSFRQLTKWGVVEAESWSAQEGHIIIALSIQTRCWDGVKIIHRILLQIVYYELKRKRGKRDTTDDDEQQR